MKQRAVEYAPFRVFYPYLRTVCVLFGMPEQSSLCSGIFFCLMRLRHIGANFALL